jgi:hypothetical protein
MNRALLYLFCTLSLLSLGTCQRASEPLPPRAFRVTDRTQLFGGGPRALGEVGDYMLQNDRIRVVIQNAGFSRGFGVYGGGIIDADLRRFDEQGRSESNRLGGHDIFAEMFPSFFFQAVACDKVEVLSDGTKPFEERYGTSRVRYEQGVAVVRASGGGGEFLTLLKVFDSLFLSYLLPTASHSSTGTSELVRLALLLGLPFADFAAELNKLQNENARYEVDYVLRPGARRVEIHSRIINKTRFPLQIPSSILANPTFQQQIGGVDLSTVRVPIGMVMLYGRMNNVWLPGTGFDLRHPLERSFARGLPLPAFNGVVTEFIASAASRQRDRVSYGLAAAPSETNFVKQNADAYRNLGKYKDTFTPIDNTSLLVPFTAISFIGVFSDSVKTTIAPGGFVEMTQYFIVGGGDVASIVDDIHGLRGTTTGSYQGILRSLQGGESTASGQVLIYQALGLTTAAFAKEDDYLDAGLRLCAATAPNSLCRPYSQDYPDDAGNLFGSLPPGRYAYRVQSAGRPLGPFVPFEVRAGESTFIDPVLPPLTYLQALVVDQSGRPLPAKVSVVAQYDRALTNTQRRSGAVFDVQAGEDYLFSDMLPDSKEGQRAVIEAVAYTGADGHVTIPVRPGRYTVYFSRGFEYDLASVPIEVESGNAASVSAQLTRVVDTTGWMSMDAHVHSENSIDSRMGIAPRVTSAAGEGVEIAISTDHNFISDWRPMVDQLALRPWLTSFVGIEFTTLESGHFNSYPLDYQVGPVTHGAFEWFGRPPDDLFAGLRKLADPRAGSNIIVCNHPRDSTQGYFNQYGRSSITGEMISQGTSKRLAGANGPAFHDAHGKSLLSYNCDALEILNGKLGHEIHSVRVPADWPDACYKPLPAGFDPKTQLDPCSLNGKILRPASTTEALVPGTILLDKTPTADPGASGLDNVEAVFPGAVDDWFHLLNQGFRHTAIAASDTHADVGEEPGAPRTYLYFGDDDPVRVDAARLVDAVKVRRAATLSHGPFLTFTVSNGAEVTAAPIGSEVKAPDGKVTVNYRLAAPPWVSVGRIHVYVNGRMVQRILVDPDRSLADTALPPHGPVSGQLMLTLPRDSWIVLEAVGDRPMFPVVTGTEEPFLLVSDAVGALAGPLGIAATTDIGAVVVGNEQPYALTNPVWVQVGRGTSWRPPGVVPWKELNVPAQDPGVGVLRTRNHN